MGKTALQPPTTNRSISSINTARNPTELDDRRTRSIGLLSLDIYLFWFSLYLFVPILSVYAQSLGASLSMVGFIVIALFMPLIKLITDLS